MRPLSHETEKAMIALTLAVALGLPANCTGCDFARRDLRGADLSNVSYVGVDLAGSDLRGANLRNANLTGVDLARADLRNADLRGANLTGVDLYGAQMHGARFDGVNVTGADLRGALNGLDRDDLRGIMRRCIGCDARNADLEGKRPTRRLDRRQRPA